MSSTDSRRRVAITGIGAVTPVGNDAPTMWAALLAGQNGVAAIRGFDASGFPVRIAAEVKALDATVAISDPRLRKYAMRQHGFAVAAATEALRDAGVRPRPDDAPRWGCVVGAGMMGVGFDALETFAARYASAGVLRPELLARTGAADVVAFARSQVNAGLSLLVQTAGIRGYASTVHTACASGGQAIGQALTAIRAGMADAALAGGFDSMVSPVGLAGFCLLGALSPDNDTPARASRPFDRTRNGFVLGEGAGFVVLEEWSRAVGRGARIYAELAGQGNSLSSYRITDSHPSGDGPIQAMRAALADADILDSEVDYLNAHGTSTPMNDRSECVAVRAVFGANAHAISVSSTKSLMGHLIAAAGAVEAVVCALAIREQTVPPNANLQAPDPECALTFAHQSQRRTVRAALSNSFGFGGSNNCLVFRHPDEVPR
jgi:3-oxoacyl-(acyl-carrier-protein) synthase